MAVKVEISHGGSVLTMPFSNRSEVELEAIESFVKHSFGLRVFVLKYLDDEQDVCTLTALSLPDALHLAGENPLKLRAVGTTTQEDDDRDWELVPELAPRSDGGGDSAAEGVAADVLAPEGEEVAAPSPTSWIAALGSLFSPFSGGFSAEAAADAETAAAAVALVPAEGEEEEAAPVPALEAAEAPEEAPLEGGGAWGGDGSGEAARAPEDSQGDLSDEDKVSFVLAAFDADRDAHLNLEEFNDLQQAAAHLMISSSDFGDLCQQFGVDFEAEGFDTESLAKLYASSGNLERDFKASVESLQSEGGARTKKARAPTFRRLLPIFTLPLVVGCPALGVPVFGLALAAAASSN
mmetsp:Transcript_78250/g.198908  ORF Transcript_78250/g.198908 Transcript_78250/m.198908 type:complete len:351 (-) Transcript_78250:58-1110(-)|eukprot:CAMPEP_0183506962 /NCGR_PEP_ID=MMETSP0371-20130417/7861_1 /TAXON_ID=268820 /ORGANISM="Peridinium aciculiferum, Strain PAER-2" /LENGTH=350 /DNA_ID=CAMNT_0025703061 /DNA_START=65 /DNA_END=1117 /DNA_ORIENTATION=-